MGNSPNVYQLLYSNENELTMVHANVDESQKYNVKKGPRILHAVEKGNTKR